MELATYGMRVSEPPGSVSYLEVLTTVDKLFYKQWLTGCSGQC